MTIASQLTNARATWSATLKRATLTPYTAYEHDALVELVNAFDYAIAQFTVDWCRWCDRPTVDCACHLDPNGLPASKVCSPLHRGVK